MMQHQNNFITTPLSSFNRAATSSQLGKLSLDLSLGLDLKNWPRPQPQGPGLGLGLGLEILSSFNITGSTRKPG